MGITRRHSRPQRKTGKTKLSKDITIETVISESYEDSKNPLVILFPFMLAPERVIEKYTRIYLDRGFDVLTHRGRPFHIFRPSLAKKCLARFLKNTRDILSDRTLLIHGISGGSLMVGILMGVMVNDSYGRSLISSIAGIVLDSITITKTSKQITDSSLRGFKLKGCVAATISFLFNLYFRITRKYTAEPIFRAVDALAKNPFECPILTYYCYNDFWGNVEDMEEFISCWEDQGLSVKHVSWEKSRHASHLHFHRDEYLKALDAFLDSVNLQVQF